MGIGIKRTCNKPLGFTLIEMIGVLAVMAILSAVIAPPVIQQFNRALSDSESTNLKALASSLNEFILTHHSIPGNSTWVSDVASVSMLPTEKVATNSRGFSRAYYVDPASMIDPLTGYTQTNGQIAMPTSPRIMIISDLRANMTISLTSATVFNQVWEQTVDSPIIESANVKIERIYLGSMFHHIILTNLNAPAPPSNPQYMIDASGLYPVGSGLSLSLYLLQGSKLSLMLHTGDLNAAVLAVQTDTFQYSTNGTLWFWSQ